MQDDEVVQKRDDLARLREAPVHPEGSRHDDRSHGDIQQHPHHGVGHGHGHLRLAVGPDGGFVGFRKPVLLVLRPGQGLDDPHAGHVLLDAPDQLLPRLLGLGEEGDAPLGDQQQHPADEGQGAEEDQRQDGLHHGADQQAADEQNGGPDPQAQHPIHHVVDPIGVGGEPGDEGGHGEPIHLLAG